MSHLDPELTALIALGEDVGDRQHLAGCAECQAQVDRLAAVVSVARDEGACPSRSRRRNCGTASPRLPGWRLPGWGPTG
jgi:hypothetical protein